MRSAIQTRTEAAAVVHKLLNILTLHTANNCWIRRDLNQLADDLTNEKFTVSTPDSGFP